MIHIFISSWRIMNVIWHEFPYPIQTRRNSHYSYKAIYPIQRKVSGVRCNVIVNSCPKSVPYRDRWLIKTVLVSERRSSDYFITTYCFHYKPSSPQNHSTRKHQLKDLLCYTNSQFLKWKYYNLLMRNGDGIHIPWGLKGLIFLFG